ncbi:unnamed protein product [Meloidogyne enterolobii]|uniref:Uncharacterized protein n=1 Tax=Meloidogyne enterolobii TaxID=390850 RepID=A0ACB0ZAN8_MELEN
MGRPSANYPRLLKIEMPTKIGAQMLIRNRGRLREHAQFKNVRLRESLSSAGLKAKKELEEECKAERTRTGLDYIIYAGKVIKRDEIPNFRKI